MHTALVKWTWYRFWPPSHLSTLLHHEPIWKLAQSFNRPSFRLMYHTKRTKRLKTFHFLHLRLFIYLYTIYLMPVDNSHAKLSCMWMEHLTKVNVCTFRSPLRRYECWYGAVQPRTAPWTDRRFYIVSAFLLENDHGGSQPAGMKESLHIYYCVKIVHSVSYVGLRRNDAIFNPLKPSPRIQQKNTREQRASVTHRYDCIMMSRRLIL